MKHRGGLPGPAPSWSIPAQPRVSPPAPEQPLAGAIAQDHDWRVSGQRKGPRSSPTIRPQETGSLGWDSAGSGCRRGSLEKGDATGWGLPPARAAPRGVRAPQTLPEGLPRRLLRPAKGMGCKAGGRQQWGLLGGSRKGQELGSFVFDSIKIREMWSKGKRRSWSQH